MGQKEGEILQKWAKSKGIKTTELAGILDMARENVYKLYKSDVLPNKYREILRPRGFDIENVTNVYKEVSANSDLSEQLKIYKGIVEDKGVIIKMQEKEIKELEAKVMDDSKTIQSLKNTIESLNKKLKQKVP